MEEAKKKVSVKLPIIIGVIVLLVFAVGLAVWLYGNRGGGNTFRNPTGIMLGEDGQLYIADEGNNNIICMNEKDREVVAGYTLPLDLYNRASGGYQDGEIKKALFDQPFDLVEWYGGIAVSDSGNHCIRLIVEGDKVRTLAGNGEEGYQNGYASKAAFSNPSGLAVGADGNLYIADSGNGAIRVLSLDGEVTTLTEDLDTPVGLCADGDALYITDIGTNQIYKYEENTLKVVAGAAYSDEEVDMEDGDASRATFSKPCGVYAKDGIVYVADTGFSAVRKIEDGKVTTLTQFEGTGTDLWPARPVGIELLDDTLYVTDEFVGVVFKVKTDVM